MSIRVLNCEECGDFFLAREPRVCGCGSTRLQEEQIERRVITRLVAEEIEDQDHRFVVFDNGRVAWSRFSNCRFNGASFTGTSLQGCEFDGCDLRGSNIDSAPLPSGSGNSQNTFTNCKR